MTLLEFSAVFVAAAAGACLHGSVGFGLALIAAPFLLLIDPTFVPAPIIVNAVILVGAIALRERKAVDVSEVSWAVVGCIIGSVVGAWVLISISKETFALAFGLMLLVAVLLSLFRWKGTPGSKLILAAGALSGLMGTTTSIGGPPLALVYQNATGEKLRATLSVYFFVASIIALASLGIAGRFGLTELEYSGYLLPGIVTGLLLSHYTRHWLRPAAVKPVVLGLSGAAALFILARYFWRIP